MPLRAINHRFVPSDSDKPTIWYPGSAAIPMDENAIRRLLDFHNDWTTMVRLTFEDGSAVEFRYDPEVHDGFDT